MKLKILLSGLAVAAAFSAGTVKAQVLKTVTFTMTTYTQGTNNDNGIVNTYAASKIKTWSTQGILNLLAQDKFAQGKWGSTAFPAGSKLASSNEQWMVVSSANYLLVDVSDILHASAGGSNEVMSGKQNDLTQLAAPSLKTMELVKITFDDTAIAGGNHTSFYLQGLSTKTITDTTPTVAGVYTETSTGQVIGAAGEGTWSDGTPFVCSGNLTITGKMTVGKTNLAGGFAPASLSGYSVAMKAGGRGNAIVMVYGDSTWSQAGGPGDTNVDDYCAGTYSYVKTGPNTAIMTSQDIGIMQDLGGTNHSGVNITFTSATSGMCAWRSGRTGTEEKGTGTWTLSRVSDLAPATLAGKSFTATNNATISTFAFTDAGTFTEARTDSPSASGTYTFTKYSPTVAILGMTYTSGDGQGILNMEMIFTTSTNATIFGSYYRNPALFSYPDTFGGPKAITLQ